MMILNQDIKQDAVTFKAYGILEHYEIVTKGLKSYGSLTIRAILNSKLTYNILVFSNSKFFTEYRYEDLYLKPEIIDFYGHHIRIDGYVNAPCILVARKIWLLTKDEEGLFKKPSLFLRLQACYEYAPETIENVSLLMFDGVVKEFTASTALTHQVYRQQ